MTKGGRALSWAVGALAVGAFAAVFYAEHRRPLRRPTESKPRRDLRNTGIAALSAATLRVLEKPVVEFLAALVERRRWGLDCSPDLSPFTPPAGSSSVKSHAPTGTPLGTVTAATIYSETWTSGGLDAHSP